MKLSIWHIPQVPMKAFRVEVKDLEQAKLLLDTLANYDIFQFENKVKPDYCNAQGLSVWDELAQEWTDWEDEETGISDIDEYFEMLAE